MIEKTNIGYVELNSYSNPTRYRMSNSITWEPVDDTLDNIAKKIIKHRNSKIREWVDEATSDDIRKEREKNYRKYHWVKIQYWVDEHYDPIVI